MNWWRYCVVGVVVVFFALLALDVEPRALGVVIGLVFCCGHELGTREAR